MPAAGAARARALLLAGQPDRAARARPAPHGPARRRADADPHAGARHRRAPGRPASGCWSASARTRGGRPGALRAPHGRAAAGALDGAPRRDAARRCTCSEAERDRIAEALRLAEQLGGETVTHPGPRRRRARSSRYAEANNVTHIVIGKPHALALARAAAGLARARADAREPATSASTSSPARRGAEPPPAKPAARRRRCRLRPRGLPGDARRVVAAALGVGIVARPVPRRRRTSRSSS